MNDNLKPVNILVGRFQPFTNGHAKCCNDVFIRSSLKTVLLLVETTKVDVRHPFLTSMLMPAYDKLKRNEYIEDVILVSNADIVKNAELCKNKGYIPKTWSCGTDRYSAYNKMAKRYTEKAGLPEDFEVIEIDRDEESISATRVRELIRLGAQRQFETLCPKELHSMYYKMKKTIEEIYK